MAGVLHSPTLWRWTVSGALLICSGCGAGTPSERLVLTQAPARTTPGEAADILDVRYPPGSRVAVVAAPFERGSERILSPGFSAAGQPCMSYDGEHVIFTGKRDAGGEWQLYEAPLSRGEPRALTSIPGGAMSPALLPDDRLVFVSPVPTHSGEDDSAPPALYVQAHGEPPQQITFVPGPVSDPEVIGDGRILFVGPLPSAPSGGGAGSALYTVNSDGTEITAFAGQHEGTTMLRRPRELPDGRVVFLADGPDAGGTGGRAEYVEMARPFQSRKPLFADEAIRVEAVEAAGERHMLVTAVRHLSTSTSPVRALFRVPLEASALAEPLVANPDWDILEGLAAAPRRPPMGRLSTVKLEVTTGTMLCLDANDSTILDSSGAVAAASRVRVLTRSMSGEERALGEVELQPDGSFMAEVPSNVPLGFEALDEDGQVLRRVAPLIWLRPAENRGCMGCHEPHNQTPRNQRPLAVDVPIPRLLSAEPAPPAAP